MPTLAHAPIALAFHRSIVLLMHRPTKHLLRPVVSRIMKLVSGAAPILLGRRLLMTRSPA
jgi:hypothetical protein